MDRSRKKPAASAIRQRDNSPGGSRKFNAKSGAYVLSKD
jgi:hypothetical protein